VYEEPYRLYNLDVFEYVTDSPFGLYGAVPLLIAHDRLRSAAVFWPNPSELYVDVRRTAREPGGSVGGGGDGTTQTHWVAESGVVDLFVLFGPTPRAVTSQYASLTGLTPLPPLWAIGYHQCRWNYNDDADVRSIDASFEELDFPYDVVWLDIEHTDGKRYFTWDARKFGDPVGMTEHLAARGHKLVTIIDPHIKVDSAYPVYQRAKERGLFVRTHANETFEGWCWPGTSSYLDFLEGETRGYWSDQLQLDAYAGSTHHTHVWNDMNEPSVFNGPEVTMQKDCLHARGTVEHRDLHNMYGHLQAMATREGLLRREALGVRGSERGRTFILTRSFFAGTQRSATVWTGDNMGKWDHLAASVPMLLTLGLSGIVFSGADVGGTRSAWLSLRARLHLVHPQSLPPPSRLARALPLAVSLSPSPAPCSIPLLPPSLPPSLPRAQASSSTPTQSSSCAGTRRARTSPSSERTHTLRLSDASRGCWASRT
jgi:alpha 1,3-glucosidase